MKLKLVTGRTIMQGIAMEADGKFSEKYRKAVAYIELNPKVIEELGCNGRVRVKSDHGEVVLEVKPNKNISEDIAFIPMGPWANVLIDPYTSSIGMPRFKDTIVTIEACNDPPTTLEDILRMYGVKGIEYKSEEKPVKRGFKRVVEDFICPSCGQLCDFLKLELDGDLVLKNIGGCGISAAKLLNYHKDRILKPYVRSGDGGLREVSMDEALDKAAEILANSKYPLLFGWSSTCNEASEAGVELAEILGGVIDNTSVCHAPTAFGAGEVGTARATLGVIMHLADVIVLWGCNPMHTHPNHFKRWIFSGGKRVSGRRDRRVIVVDVRRTTTADQADIFIQVEPGRDYELITALRMAIRDLEIEAEKVAGVPREKILEMAEIMRSARYGVIFEGMGVTMTGLIKLAHDLNEYTRFTLIPMRGHYNVTGSINVFLWNTGYPLAIDFSRGYPKMIPGVTTSTELLVNGEVDAALIVASDPVAHLPRKAVEHLARIPVIVVDSKWNLTTTVADVIIPAGLAGIECEGTAYRLDGVPLRLKKLTDPPPGVLCDTEIIRELIRRVKKLRGVSE